VLPDFIEKSSLNVFHFIARRFQCFFPGKFMFENYVVSNLVTKRAQFSKYRHCI